LSITVPNLPYYLIGCNVLDAATIVSGELAIVDASRRKRNSKVICNAGPGLHEELKVEAINHLDRFRTSIYYFSSMQFVGAK
jgi:hypothetical protein